MCDFPRWGVEISTNEESTWEQAANERGDASAGANERCRERVDLMIRVLWRRVSSGESRDLTHPGSLVCFVSQISIKSPIIFIRNTIKYQDVGCVSHFLVQYYNKNNKKIANKANNDDEREDYGDDDGHHGHQDLQVFLIHITHVGQDTLVGHCVIHD